jgi:hypothetical protein
MLVKSPWFRGGGCLLLSLVLGIPWLMAGCGEGGGDKPAAFDEAQKKKNQELMSGGYRDQIFAHYKGKVDSKDAAKKKP